LKKCQLQIHPQVFYNRRDDGERWEERDIEDISDYEEDKI
jgi:hypothetical protein